jgi:hypothetical protein
MLTANRTYYVRSDGSDSNTGLTNTSGGAFATFQHAFDVAAALDLGIYAVTIEAGTVSTFGSIIINAPLIGGTALNLVGNGATLTTSTDLGTIQVMAAQTTPINVSGFTITNTRASGSCVRLDAAAKLVIGSGMTFGACASAHMRANVPGSYLSTTASYTISGSAASHMIAVEQGGIRVNGGTVTITGTPSFSSGYASASLGAHIFVVSASFSGSATGPRYAVATGGIVATNGAGATYLPGNSAGTNDGTGVYA